MARSALILTLFACVAAVALAGDVLDLTKANWDEITRKEDALLVEFFAPWCGHCKRLEPEYEKAATELLKNDPPIRIAKVDATVESELASKFGVSGYPTIKLFRKGEVAGEYQGGRDATSFVKYMRSQVGPSSKTIASAEELTRFLSNEDVSVVGFFDNESALYRTFLKAADKLRENFRFAHTLDAGVLAANGVSGSAVFVYQPPKLDPKGESTKQEFSGDNSVTDLEAFIYRASVGPCSHVTTENKDRFERRSKEDGLPLVTVYYNVDYRRNAKGTNYWRNRVLKVANEFAGKAIVAIGSESEFRGSLSQAGVEVREFVTVAEKNGKRFVRNGEFSVDGLRAFVAGVLDGSVEPYVKSEPVPQSQNADEAVVVVGKTFDDIVMDPTKDVLIEFYAPWCGHCKSLEPKYNELASKLKGEPNIIIAKMDATANEGHPAFAVQGYPTIYFAPANNKLNPKKFTGEREVEGFLKYLKQEATVENNIDAVISGAPEKKKKKKQEL